MHPKDAKIKLAEEIVSQYHSKLAAEKARLEFERVFANKETPQEIPIYKLTPENNIIDIILKSGLAGSKNEVRRLVQQGAVMLDNKKIDKEGTVIATEGILKVGKRRFLKLIK
jgi:tyrosyl-tRNA synthetase